MTRHVTLDELLCTKQDQLDTLVSAEPPLSDAVCRYPRVVNLVNIEQRTGLPSFSSVLLGSTRSLGSRQIEALIWEGRRPISDVRSMAPIKYGYTGYLVGIEDLVRC